MNLTIDLESYGHILLFFRSIINTSLDHYCSMALANQHGTTNAKVVTTFHLQNLRSRSYFVSHG